MSMPKAAVDEDCYLVLLKDEVWLSWQAIDISQVLKASRIEQVSQLLLRQRACAAHCLHNAPAFPSRKNIHEVTSSPRCGTVY
jgi:hypothetical protein